MSLPVPPLRSPGHDDGALDAIALVEACLREDLEGAGALLRNWNDPADVAISAVKLLAEAVKAGEHGHRPCRCHFREWALLAIRRA